MSEKLVSALKEGVAMLKRKDDDMFDRLSNRYTIGLLVVCSLFLATKTYVGDPIDCFTPKEFHDNWVKYTDNYCWIKNTYFIPLDKSLPGPDGLPTFDHNSGPELQYYQWVPIILAFMLLFFAVPTYFWQFAMWSSGYDIEAVIKTMSKSENLDPKTRDDTNQYVVAQLDRHITYHRHLGGKARIPIGNRYGRYLFFMYIITKLLYIAVPIALLYILNVMMGEGYLDYGIRAAEGLIKDDGSYIENPMFPRITLCDFAVRRMGGNIHRYTVQCVLTVNLFNEKVFLIIWWWLVILTCLSGLGLILCLLRAFVPNGSNNFILKYLKIMRVINPNSETDRRLLNTFTNEYLSLDGVFCMRLIAKNTTDVIAAEIITELFRKWKEEHADKANIAGGSSQRSLVSDA